MAERSEEVGRGPALSQPEADGRHGLLTIWFWRLLANVGSKHVLAAALVLWMVDRQLLGNYSVLPAIAGVTGIGLLIWACWRWRRDHALRRRAESRPVSAHYGQEE